MHTMNSMHTNSVPQILQMNTNSILLQQAPRNVSEATVLGTIATSGFRSGLCFSWPYRHYPGSILRLDLHTLSLGYIPQTV